ncbi:MAG: iron-containing alcohol dehydrogenase, partial [Halioglobus sp.]|nr:iron-containing alcohol dehydrogenase [Halioglobus sp.]
FQKGLGAIHAISHPVGARYNTHHGTTNAVVMPAVVTFNRPAIAESIERLANYLDISGGFDGFVQFLSDQNAAMHIPKSLTELGVIAPDIDALSAAALADPSAASNPVRMTPENTRRLLQACL